MKKKPTETKEFNILSSFKVKEDSSEETLTIEGIANFSGDFNEETGEGCFIDLAGEVVVPSGMDISLYKKNPVILWQHEREDVIGRALSITKKPDGIYIKAEIHAGAMDPEDFYKIKAGLVSMFSIGFRCKAGEYKDVGGKQVFFITKSTLFETSCVSIPCNYGSAYSIVKSLGDDGFYGEVKQADIEQPNEEVNEEDSTNKTGESDEMKLKFRDTLSADDVAKLESLGLTEKLDELVEVDIKEFIGKIVDERVKSAFAEVDAAKEAARIAEANAVIEEAKRKEQEAIAESLGVTVEELAGLSEDEVKARQDELSNSAKETEEALKSLLDKLENTTKELTI